MTRRPLAEDYADSMQDAIVDGAFEPGARLPSESDLATHAGLSRLTVREGIKILQAKGLVSVEVGRGTFVSPVHEWSLMDPVLLIARSHRHGEPAALPRMLIEARRLVEVGATTIAATRRTTEDLQDLERSHAQMQEGTASDDVALFVEGDIQFHRRILDATGNSFIAALFDPLDPILRLTRFQTSAHEEVRKHAIAHHGEILRLLTAEDASGAGHAMGLHIDQTEQDFIQYVTNPTQSLLDFRGAVPTDLASRRDTQFPPAPNNHRE